MTGIEPGTSYAYPRQIERKQGRVKTLAPFGKQTFDLTYQVMTTTDEVAGVQKTIDAITAGRETKLVSKPMAKE